MDLNQVEINSNTWKEDIYLNSDAARLDQLAGDPGRGMETVHHQVNALIFNIPYKNRTIQIVEEVHMERKTLEMKLALKEESVLHVNSKNPEEYYLDLEFLE